MAVLNSIRCISRILTPLMRISVHQKKVRKCVNGSGGVANMHIRDSRKKQLYIIIQRMLDSFHRVWVVTCVCMKGRENEYTTRLGHERELST